MKKPQAKEAAKRVAPAYNETRKYRANDVVQHGGKFYRARTDVLPYENPPNKKLWREVSASAEPPHDQPLHWS